MNHCRSHKDEGGRALRGVSACNPSRSAAIVVTYCRPLVVAAAAVLLSSAAAAMAPAADQSTKVEIPALPPDVGDVIAPLPKGSPSPSSDPRNLEGLWVGLGRAIIMDGQFPPFQPAVLAERNRRRDMEARGTPVLSKGTLCRPPGMVAVTGNQFPTQIIQRPDKILIIAEENRGVWPIYMNAEHPKNLKPAHVGHNIGRWEGNTLVIDSIGFRGNPGGLMTVTHSDAVHVVTRITRANTGAGLDGERLVVSRTITDPQVYQRPWTSVHVARWRPDVQMLEFNCEESSTELGSDGLIVE